MYALMLTTGIQKTATRNYTLFTQVENGNNDAVLCKDQISAAVFAEL